MSTFKVKVKLLLSVGESKGETFTLKANILCFWSVSISRVTTAHKENRIFLTRGYHGYGLNWWLIGSDSPAKNGWTDAAGISINRNV